MSPTPKKEKTINLRISKDQLVILNKLSEITGKSISDLIRTSMGVYYNILKLPGKPGRQMIIHDGVLRILFQNCSDADIHALAKNTFQTGMEETLIDQLVNPQVQDPNLPDNFFHHLLLLS